MYFVVLCVVCQMSVQLKQYHDDLLAACLELILALPDEIVVTHLNIVIPALQVSLQLFGARANRYTS